MKLIHKMDHIHHLYTVRINYEMKCLLSTPEQVLPTLALCVNTCMPLGGRDFVEKKSLVSSNVFTVS
eukprot:c39426_g1_i1 orf=2-199(-)